MDQSNRDIKLGKFLSLVLRHQPELIKISLDENGYTDVEDLIRGIKETGRHINKEDLERIVRENEKQRYKYNEDHTKIRASQGHSVFVNLDLKKQVPPDKLYHGTAIGYIESIKRKGIIKQSRQYVHLSADIATAESVGKRHGRAVILVVDSRKMEADGYEFYLSENNVWLCDEVPYKYILNTINR